MPVTTTRRTFLQGIAGGGAALTLKYSTAAAAAEDAPAYRRFEDVYRAKWTWDRVARGTHGTNCAGTCAFNVYIKNGVVWREEQQGIYEPSGGDAPDYGPRGCNKGLRHHKYMYGKQRVLYPMKRAGERGEGKWQRVTWEEACDEIADKFLDLATEYGPECVSYGSGTQMSVKLASFSSLFRFGNITGMTVPEFYSGVGDLPTGVYTTVGQVYLGDVMASVFESKCCFVWMSNPAVTRIPDAHFFWEAKYNGTEVVAISPEFTPTAMHSSKWLNPKPGTDLALAMAFINVIIEEGYVATEYVKEQTDMPLLVRKDNGQFLRAEDLSLVSMLAVEDNVFYMWDEATGDIVQAPGTGLAEAPVTRDRRRFETLDLGAIQPALEGSWTVKTRTGEVEVTTVYELTRQRAREHTPEIVAGITGVSAEVIRQMGRKFGAARPAMIYTGYAACKWLHGDMLQRAMLLMLSLTGNIGVEGGGIQFANAPKTRGISGFGFADIGPAFRMISSTTWDYDHGNMKEMNAEFYGQELADDYDAKYRYSVEKDYFPDYSKQGWKMGIFAGNNGANWRGSNTRWRKEAFDKLEMIVTLCPDMATTAHNSDFVLPIAHHYERADIMLQARTPYLQVLDKAVEPLGESKNDWEANLELAKAISRRAKARGIGAIRDEVDGRTVRRDFQRAEELYTMNGRVKDVTDVCQFLINTTPGLPKVPFAELAEKGIIRVNGADSAMWESDESPYHTEVVQSVREKKPYETFTGRQQFYIDHEWFLEYDEQLPAHRDPLRLKDYPLQFMMGHARHGIHSMWRDDSLLLSLQRGAPDAYVSAEDARERDVEDGDTIRIFNSFGEFTVIAHISSGIQPGMIFMYHGWDPMMFKDQQNFGSIISTAGLIKPTTVAGDWGHLGYHALKFAPNQTYKDFTCDFELVSRSDAYDTATVAS